MILESPSPNFTRRTSTISAIIIYDVDTAEGALARFTDPTSRVSTHYLIGNDGNVFRCVDDDAQAWHSPFAALHNNDNVNDFSIGIALASGLTEDQTSALLDLCVDLCLTYNIPLNRIVGHMHVVPFSSMGEDFPWFDFLNTLGALIAAAIMKGD